MKKIIFLFLLLIIIPNTYSQGIGVSPSEIDSGKCGTLYVINPTNHKILIESQTPKEISINKKTFPLYSKQKSKLEVCSNEKVNTTIEIINKNQFSSSIKVPVKLNPPIEEPLKINNKKTKGIIGVALINIIGVITLFTTKWMKKHS